jgi:hypothetical protein
MSEWYFKLKMKFLHFIADKEEGKETFADKCYSLLALICAILWDGVFVFEWSIASFVIQIHISFLHHVTNPGCPRRGDIIKYKSEKSIIT